MDESIRDKVCRSIVPIQRELPSDCVAFRLPNAPSLQFYCVYGHGKETEVSIRLSSQFSSQWHGLSTYRYNTEPYGDGDVGEAVDIEVCVEDNTCPERNLHSQPEIPFSRSWIDREYSHETSYPRVSPICKK